MPLIDYQPGTKAICYVGTETAPYPAGAAKPAETLALPSGGLVWGGWLDVPETTDDAGAKAIYGPGSRFPQTVIPGGHIYRTSLASRVGNVGLVRNSMVGSKGADDVADLAIATGLSNISGDGFTDVLRFAKANSGTLGLNEGSAQEITFQGEYWGLTELPGTAVTPTNTDFGAYGAPLTWHNVNTINYNSINRRDIVAAMSFGWQNNLMMKGFRPDYGPDSIWSSVPYAQMAGIVSYSCTFGFHTQNAKSSVFGLAKYGTVTGPISVVVSNVGSTTEGSVQNGFTVNVGPGRIGPAVRRGGDTSAELMSNVTIIPTYITITPLGG